MKNRVFSISLAVMLVLSVGLIGCGSEEVPEITEYDLTISSTEGGSVTTPGEGTFTYDEGEVVELVAEAEEGYQFANWTGDVSAIPDINAATTTITMSDHYSVTANFEEMPPRIGAWLDEVTIMLEPYPTEAVLKLRQGQLDVFACGLADSTLYAEVLADPDLVVLTGGAQFREFTFNPVGPTFPETGKLNPFSVPEFREAMHWLIDREYIAEEIWGGLAVPRYTCLDSDWADAAERFPDVIVALEAKYAHNPAKAEAVITEEMEKLGAVLEGGKWTYNGEQVELMFLIRIEDERKEMGEYFATLLEGVGFTVTRQYGTLDSLRPIWLGDPFLGLWHVYTGGWVNTIIYRDERDQFGAFYTNLLTDLGPLWQAYVNDPDFYEAAERLWNYDYASMEERAELFDVCLPMSMEDNVRMFLVTLKAFSPMRDDVRLAADLAGGISGSWMWALTAHFADDEGTPIVGGSMRMATTDILTDPWNPIAGTNWVYDTFAIRATTDRGLHPDTRDGLRWPGRIERAEVYVQEGMPMGVTHDWVTLESVSEIIVPPDAWVDWDAAEQKFITVAERFPEGTTALTRSVVYYPKDIFSVPLHDGSTISLGDFILYAILRFDRAKEASAIYDEAAVSEFNGFMETFKGVRFITDDPDYGLIVETYSDRREIDAELCVTTWFPSCGWNPLDLYSYSSGFWHTIALGVRAEEAGELAFSADKAARLGVEWMDYTRGASLPRLKKWMNWATTENYVPYAPTLAQHVSVDEVAQRWTNLQDWYAEKGHFWVGSGPFYLEALDPVEKIIHLERFADYPDPADKWLFLLEPLP